MLFQGSTTTLVCGIEIDWDKDVTNNNRCSTCASHALECLRALAGILAIEISTLAPMLTW